MASVQNLSLWRQNATSAVDGSIISQDVLDGLNKSV